MRNPYETRVVGPAPYDNPSANLDAFAAQIEEVFGYAGDNRCAAVITGMAERIYSWLKLEYPGGGALMSPIVRQLFLAMAERPARFVSVRDL